MYASALNFVCGVIEPGFAITCPRSMSRRSTPLNSKPTLSPATPSSNSFLNISTPVHTVCRVGRIPTISTCSFTFTRPRSMRPVATIQGRGTVATGRIERGRVKVNEQVEIVGIRPTRQTVCTGVEMFKKLLDEGVAGDNVGLLLRGVERRDIERGQVIAKPGSITPHTKFKAEAYILTKEEGGRHTPFFTGYRPEFYFRTTDVTGVAQLPEGVS